MDKSGENDDQKIATSNSGATGGTPNVNTKVAPRKKLENKGLKACGTKADVFDEEYWKGAEEINLTPMTAAQFVDVANAYWAKNPGNRN